VPPLDFAASSTGGDAVIGGKRGKVKAMEEDAKGTAVAGRVLLGWADSGGMEDSDMTTRMKELIYTMADRPCMAASFRPWGAERRGWGQDRRRTTTRPCHIRPEENIPPEYGLEEIIPYRRPEHLQVPARQVGELAGMANLGMSWTSIRRRTRLTTER